jgi:hypothetical protein
MNLTKRTITKMGLGAAMASLLMGNAQAAMIQISLNPSDVYAGGHVESASGLGSSLYNQGPYAAGNVLSQQTGQVTESLSAHPSGDWIASGTQGTLYINLGRGYEISSIEFFNTHDGKVDDTGSQKVSVFASNSSNLSHHVTLLNHVSLSSVAHETTIVGQTFNVANPNSYQYLEIDALASMCSNAGLDEIRVFTDPVPELPAPLMLSLGLLIPMVVRRRSQQSLRASTQIPE